MITTFGWNGFRDTSRRSPWCLEPGGSWEESRRSRPLGMPVIGIRQAELKRENLPNQHCRNFDRLKTLPFSTTFLSQEVDHLEEVTNTMTEGKVGWLLGQSSLSPWLIMLSGRYCVMGLVIPALKKLITVIETFEHPQPTTRRQSRDSRVPEPREHKHEVVWLVDVDLALGQNW